MKAEVDSREVGPGDTFYALEGARTDGHLYLEQVALAGAARAVVKKNYQGSAFGLELQKVDDVLKSLQRAAAERFRRLQRPTIAITGSVGKTTTKGFLKTLLSERWRVSSSLGSQNGQVGLPLSILRASDNEQIFVLEMGMSEAGQLKQLVEIAPPKVALITTVSHVHAQHFRSLQEIALAKGEIMVHPETELGIIGHETPHLPDIAKLGRCEKWTYSVRANKADYFGQLRFGNIEVYERSQLLLSCPWNATGCLRGEHHAYNFVGAVAAARAVGMRPVDIVAAVPKLELPALRGHTLERDGVTFLMDCYNACAASVKAALKALPAPRPGSRALAFLSEMTELGTFSENCHREVGAHALSLVDQLVCFGEGARPMLEAWEAEGRPAHWFPTRSEAFAHLKSIVEAGDVVLVKGARVHSLEELIEGF